MSQAISMLGEKGTLFTGGDPILYIIKRRVRVPGWIVAIWWFLLVNVPIAISATQNNLWSNYANNFGVIEDHGWWLMQLITFPAIVIFYSWMPTGISEVLLGLYKNNVIVIQEDSDTDKTFANFVHKFNDSYSHKRWAILCALVILPTIIFMVIPAHKTFVTWWTSGTFIFWFVEFTYVIVIFLVGMIVIKILLAIYWFRRLFAEFAVEVKVLHPDKAGGLSPLGNFSVKIAYLIGIIGLNIVIISMSEYRTYYGSYGGLSLTIPYLISFTLYFVLAPLAFFSPIGTAHTAMETGKEKFILRVSDQFELEKRELEACLGASSTELGARLEKLDQLEKLHAMASGFPVWPFNTGSLVRFISSTFSPLLISLVPSIVDFILST